MQRFVWLVLLTQTGCFSCGEECVSGAICVRSTGTPSVSAGEGAPLVVTATADGFSIAFGDVGGGVTQANLLVKNVGLAPLQLLSVGAPSDPQFDLSLGTGTTLQPGIAATARLSFTPSGAGLQEATIDLETDSEEFSSLVLHLSANAHFVLQPGTQALNFGEVTSGGFGRLPIALSNTGSRDLTVTPGPIQGPDAHLFTCDHASPFKVLAGGTQTVTMTYEPVTVSFEDVATFVLSDDSGETLAFSLQGDSRPPVPCLSLDPGSDFDFGFVQPGSSLTQGFVVSNCGSVPVAVQSAGVTADTSVSGGPALQAFTAPEVSGNLPPGETLSLTVTFAPANVGLYNAAIAVVSDPSIAVGGYLTGHGGGPAITCTPTSLDFSQVTVGTTSTLSVNCLNSGTTIPDDPAAQLVLSALSTNGGGFTAVFHDEANGEVFLDAGESATIDVTFAPTSTGQWGGTLIINTNLTPWAAAPRITLSGSVD